MAWLYQQSSCIDGSGLPSQTSAIAKVRVNPNPNPNPILNPNPMVGGPLRWRADPVSMAWLYISLYCEELAVFCLVASDGQRDEAKLYIERFVMSRIYTQAMFPNGEADIMRDQSVCHFVFVCFVYVLVYRDAVV